MAWPIDLDDVRAAQRRIAPYLTPTPLRRYVPLDEAVGRGVRVWVKHENHQPTNAFKVRNGLSVVSRLTDDEKRRGVVSATRGNHGQGLAWAGSRLGVPVTLCVPHGNNPEKNEAMRGFGGVLVEEGSDYDDALETAFRLVEREGLRMVHPTNDRFVIAGAATITAEIVEQMDDSPPEAMVVSVGGGSQAVGAMTVMRALLPGVPVFGVQAAAAPTIHDSWHAGESRPGAVAQTLADGLATRNTYEMTFDALREGLAGFVTVDEDEIAGAIRLLLRATHNLAEGAGAAGLAGLIKLRDELAGKRVAIILSGGNIAQAALRRVLAAGDWTPLRRVISSRGNRRESAMTDDIEAKLELDCRGLNCPLPMMKTNKAIEGLASGDVLKVLLTDPGSAADMDNFSRRTGHEILDRREADGEFVFYVRKA